MAALALGLAFLGAAMPWANKPASPPPAERPPADELASSLSLPDAWPAIPDGPNRVQFEALCRLCHSPRLVLTQPRFPEKKWAEVVHKMVVVYGAPIPEDQERAIVTYLTTIRGDPR